MTRGAIFVVLLGAAAVGLHATQEQTAATRLPARPVANLLYVQSPALAKRVALSYDSLAADLYWIRTVQHYGSTKLGPDVVKRYDLLFPLLDLTTSLDPKFDIAYRFGAIFLAEDQPAGASRPDLAIALLEKGLTAQPGRWQFAQDIGFVYYWWQRDFVKASEWFRKAAAMPGGPAWLEGLAAVVLTEGGDRRSSRRLWQEVLNDPGATYLQAQAEFRLRQLDALDQIDQLNSLSAQYTARAGRPPASWDELRRSGLLRGRALDPVGTEYELHPDTGVVTLSATSRLNPLPSGATAR